MDRHGARQRVFAIFEGGGVKGAAHVGALAEALKHVDIIGVGGTSAGAMVAALYAAGYEPDEMFQLMKELDYGKLARRFPFIPRRFGFRSSQYLFDWLRKKLSQKLHPESEEPVTFADKGLRCPIKLVAADIKHRRRVVFSKESHPSTEIAYCARLSMSIPFFYESLSDPTGQYVDGGIISNFPLWLFDEERRQAPDSTSLLGFDLVETPTEFPAINGWRSFARAVVHTCLTEQRRLLEEHLDHPIANTITIRTGLIRTTDFDISNDHVRDLYDRGKDAAALFFAQRFARLPSPSTPQPSLQASDPDRAIRLLALNHLYASQTPANVGTFSPVVIRYYIDLMEACLVPTSLGILAQILADHIRKRNSPSTWSQDPSVATLSSSRRWPTASTSSRYWSRTA